MRKKWLLLTVMLVSIVGAVMLQVGLLAAPTSAAAQFFTEHTISTQGEYVSSAYATDVDGDGDVDVLGTARGTLHGVPGWVTWWENSPSGLAPPADAISWTMHTIDGDFQDAKSVYATDVDGDSDTDVLGAASWDQDITWWENDGDQDFTEHTIADEFWYAETVYATDLDGDGNVDVLGGGNSIAWWESSPSGLSTPADPISWTEHTIDPGFGDTRCIYATDVDGDGDSDVLASGYQADDENISWWENSPSGLSTPADPISWTQHIIKVDFAYATSVYATDVDGDGDVDVLGTAGATTSDITWWENNPSGNDPPDDPVTWTEHTIKEFFDDATSVYATDVDGDGDTDVLGTAAGVGHVTWWENQPSGLSPPGDPVVWTEHLIKYFWGPAVSIYATDVDGDGDVDVVGAASYPTEEITWWENITLKACVPLALKNYGS